MQTKEHAFQSRACAEFAKLRTVQAEQEQEAGQACFLGCSVTETGPSFVASPRHVVQVSLVLEDSDCVVLASHCHFTGIGRSLAALPRRLDGG